MKHSLLLPACSCFFLLLLSIASCFCLFAFDLRFCFRLPLASSWFLPLRFRALPGSCSCTWPSCSCSLLSSFVYFFLSLAPCFLLLLTSCLFLLPSPAPAFLLPYLAPFCLPLDVLRDIETPWQRVAEPALPTCLLRPRLSLLPLAPGVLLIFLLLQLAFFLSSPLPHAASN